MSTFPSARRANERIAAELRDMGLDARAIDGWVYIARPAGGVLYIGAEYGMSLETSVYPLTPTWFAMAPADA